MQRDILDMILCKVKPEVNLIFKNKNDASICITFDIPGDCYNETSSLLGLTELFKNLIRSFIQSRELPKVKTETTGLDIKTSEEDSLDKKSLNFNPAQNIDNCSDHDGDNFDNDISDNDSDLTTVINIKKREKRPYTKKSEKTLKEEKIECPSCSKSFSRKYYKKYHYNVCNNHGIHPRKVMCTNCGKTFSKTTYEMTHYYECNNLPKINEVECEKCGKKFDHEHALKKHMANVHTNLDIMCDKCDFKTTNERYLLTHLKTHQKKQMITCDLCGKEVNKLSMSKHMRKHSAKMVPCDICGKEFLDTRIKNHKKRVHSRDYPCSQCNYAAADNYNLRLHISKMHLGVKDLEKFQCSFCDVQTTNLAWHIKIYHPEEK